MRRHLVAQHQDHLTEEERNGILKLRGWKGTSHFGGSDHAAPESPLGGARGVRGGNEVAIPETMPGWRRSERYLNWKEDIRTFSVRVSGMTVVSAVVK